MVSAHLGPSISCGWDEPIEYDKVAGALTAYRDASLTQYDSTSQLSSYPLW